MTTLKPRAEPGACFLGKEGLLLARGPDKTTGRGRRETVGERPGGAHRFEIDSVRCWQAGGKGWMSKEGRENDVEERRRGTRDRTARRRQPGSERKDDRGEGPLAGDTERGGASRTRRNKAGGRGSRGQRRTTRPQKERRETRRKSVKRGDRPGQSVGRREVVIIGRIASEQHQSGVWVFKPGRRDAVRQRAASR